MSFTFRQLHPLFVAEVSGPPLQSVHDEADLARLRAGMDEYAVLVWHDQPFSDEEQLAFAQRFDGALHAKTSLSVIARNRFGNDALTDVSNVDEHGDIMAANDRRRVSSVSNRLWHTDASFVDPPGRYSMLSARVIPPVPADTEFADMRAAWDALDADTRAQIDGLHAHHSIAYSREVLGFEFDTAEREKLAGVVQPLVRTIPRCGRRALYLASHASRFVEWPLPEGRLLLRDLIEHATRPEFVYAHRWRVGDFVIWDNRATMHRARPFDDRAHRRELRRTTTLDIA